MVVMHGGNHLDNRYRQAGWLTYAANKVKRHNIFWLSSLLVVYIIAGVVRYWHTLPSQTKLVTAYVPQGLRGLSLTFLLHASSIRNLSVHGVQLSKKIGGLAAKPRRAEG